MKKRVVVLYGGQSPEHEISCRSAAFVLQNLDRNRYEVSAVGIDRSGRWILQDMTNLPLDADEKFVPIVEAELEKPSSGQTNICDYIRSITGVSSEQQALSETIFFPVLHGVKGEDGTIQGMFELAGVPYVGCDHLGASMGMDKDVAKRLVVAEGIPVVPWVTLKRGQSQDDRQAVEEKVYKLGFPVYVKPANMGSSVGVSRVEEPSALSAAIDEAFHYDHKILIEKGLKIREIEVAVIGNDDPRASLAGEVAASDGFYSYDAKYLDPNAARIEVPAKLSPDDLERVQVFAKRIFVALELKGLARVDFFLDDASGQIVFNEVNTMPGFTEISQFPMLWSASGLSAQPLLTSLVELGFERFLEKNSLRLTRS